MSPNLYIILYRNYIRRIDLISKINPHFLSADQYPVIHLLYILGYIIGALYSFVYGILLFVCFFVYNVMDGTLEVT